MHNKIIQEDVIELSEIISDKYKGIYAPKDYNPDELQGVGGFFLENAEEYHKKYLNYDYTQKCIQKALDYKNISNDKQFILDIGSGSGNSIIPLLQLFPNATVVATDISPNLLAILRDSLNEDHKKRCILLCLDLSNYTFIENTFDLILGNAILHHIFKPDLLIKNIEKSLKQSEWMVFYEPFESAYSIFNILLNTLLNEYKLMYSGNRIIKKFKKKTAVPEIFLHFFNMIADDLTLRVSVDKESETFRNLDDKWLFNKSYFEKLALEINTNELVLFPLEDSEDKIVRKFKDYLWHTGIAYESLPTRFLEIVNSINNSFSKEHMRDLIFEGCIMMRKG